MPGMRLLSYLSVFLLSLALVTNGLNKGGDKTQDLNEIEDIPEDKGLKPLRTTIQPDKDESDDDTLTEDDEKQPEENLLKDRLSAKRMSAKNVVAVNKKDVKSKEVLERSSREVHRNRKNVNNKNKKNKNAVLKKVSNDDTENKQRREKFTQKKNVNNKNKKNTNPVLKKFSNDDTEEKQRREKVTQKKQPKVKKIQEKQHKLKKLQAKQPRGKKTQKQEQPEPKTESEALYDMISRMEKTVNLLGRQVMMQRFYQEEEARSSGASGIRRVRTLSHDAASHVGDGMVMTMHDHPDRRRTLGLGEMDVMLNGVEFRTAHTDYHLRRRSINPQKYGETEQIKFPEVPPAVTALPSMEEQITEMREWFKAWKDQDYTKRDYRKYFKPVVCYLEATWSKAQPHDRAHPFPAAGRVGENMNWEQHADKVMFNAYSGSHDTEHSFAYLPTTVMNMLNDSEPEMAQWNYDVLCHPISFDLPLNRLRVVNDLKARMDVGGKSMAEYADTRAARYMMAVQDSDVWTDSNKKYALLDKIMAEVPGRDNYGAVINDDVFDVTAYAVYDRKSEEPLNTAYYHRWYNARKKGALGREARHRGFSDENIFMAQTTDTGVTGMDVERCKGKLSGHLKEEHCKKWSQKWTYAIPLEIVYLTPLHRWNPLKIKDFARGHVPESKDKPEFCKGLPVFDGVSDLKAYLTPGDFFSNDPLPVSDPADTGTHMACVLAESGHQHTYASGIWVHTPAVPGVGSLRQRYPIMPVYGEGSGVWKELDALKDIVLQPSRYQEMYTEPAQECSKSEQHKTKFG